MKEISDELYQELEYLGIIDNSGVRSHNVGKSNYHTKIISPWVVWLAYPELTEFDKDIVKRVLRTKEGDSRKMDYEKIIHVCQERIRQIDIEEKYEIQNYQESFYERYIKEGEKYICKKDWIADYGDRLETLFMEGHIYHSPMNGFLQKEDGEIHPVTPMHMKEYFKRTNE